MSSITHVFVERDPAFLSSWSNLSIKDLIEENKISIRFRASLGDNYNVQRNGLTLSCFFYTCFNCSSNFVITDKWQMHPIRYFIKKLFRVIDTARLTECGFIIFLYIIVIQNDKGIHGGLLRRFKCYVNVIWNKFIFIWKI